ncbi:MAG: LacI family DNA-binding transcriptional regulator [Chloroflexi bacterium]|nr:LacI family DNA-binding transcriptional regulator [Chloroflexota bacterium]
MATIRDVAARAGVNPSTVSRAFSGQAKISEDTRQRIFVAAEALNFHPNAIARSLSVRRTQTIAIVIPHIFPGFFEDSFFPQVIRGLLEVAYQRGFRVLVGGSNSHEDNITQTFQILGSQQADGIVVLSNRLDVDTVGALRKQKMPFVLVGRPPAHYADVSWVDADNERYTQMAVAYLIQQGHQRIAFVGGDPEVAVTRERLKGYQAALDAAGIRACPEWIDYGYFAEAGGYTAVQRMARLDKMAPTAYYAANDLMAIGVMRALRTLQIAVPDQVSVIGTNNAPESLHVVPALTTVHVPYADMAALAAEILITAITNDERPIAQRYVDCELLIRDSTGPYRPDRAE